MYVSVNITHEQATITSYGTLELSSLQETRQLAHDNLVDYANAVALISQTIRELAHGGPVSGIAISVAGQVEPNSGTILSSYSYRHWDTHSLKQDLAQFACPVLAENDGVITALGCYQFTNENTKRTGCIYFARDVGIGASVINPVDDKLLIYPVEFGHTVMVPDGRTCGCGQKGCLEQYVAGRGITKSSGFATEAVHDEEILIMTARYLTQALMTLLIFYPLDTLYLTGEKLDTQRPFLETMATYTTEMLARKFIFARPDILVAESPAGTIESGNLAQLALGDRVVNMRHAT